MENQQSSAAIIREALQSAIGLHKTGRLDDAEAVYRDVLKRDKNNPDALHYLGVMLYQQGHAVLAIDFVRRAINIRPDYVDALNNLGNIFQELRSPANAVMAYKLVLEQKPDHPQASRNLRVALEKVARLKSRAEELERAIELEPDNAEHFYSLGTLYMDIGCFEEGLDMLRRAVGIKTEPAWCRRLGQMLYGQGRIEEAVQVYEAWLRVDPGSAVAQHMVAACTLKDVPARAGDAFVTETFDRFAASFDEVLTLLEYRAPVLVATALHRTDGEPSGSLDILDAGCGTGLLARPLRPYARRLVGVDLSPKMLEKAAQRGEYDETVAAELTAYLRASSAAFDVVASSDTLVYFGDLRYVLAAGHRALRPGGRLLFTLEHEVNETAAPHGYRILPHGRYVHTEAYVRKSLNEAAFEIIGIEKEVLRREGSEHVAGLLVLARRLD